MEKSLKNLSDATFEELKDKNFEVIRVVEMLCEVCQKPMSTKEKSLRKIQISTKEDYENLHNKALIHDRAKIDTEKGKIYFYDHDFPGDVHPECIEKL
jgi:DNA polymerase elongation subunit (family B)